MSKNGDNYRAQADLERRYAAEATLANVRTIHETAATKWDAMAKQADRMPEN